MQTFTEREMGEPTAVLDACDRDGEARILRGDGRVYRLAPEREAARTIRAGEFFTSAQLSQSALEDQLEELALRHTATHGFRTYDLLHVASALLLGCDTFWSFDERILKLASLEGLKSSARQRG